MTVAEARGLEPRTVLPADVFRTFSSTGRTASSFFLSTLLLFPFLLCRGLPVAESGSPLPPPPSLAHADLVHLVLLVVARFAQELEVAVAVISTSRQALDVVDRHLALAVTLRAALAPCLREVLVDALLAPVEPEAHASDIRFAMHPSSSPPKGAQL